MRGKKVSEVQEVELLIAEEHAVKPKVVGAKRSWVKAVCVLSAVLLVGLVVGCSPQQGTDAKPQQDTGSSDPIKVTWSADTDCATCHSTEDASMTNAAMGAAMHAKDAQATCMTCHTDEKKLATAHEGKTASDPSPKKLKKTTVDVATCQSAGCHDLSKEEMLALTASDTQLIDTNGTHVNPHDVIGKTEGHADITCSNCHNMHTESTNPADSCITCHHSGVYECGTCH
ncbi:MAG: cytochrome c3 family protein [Raoultibacter sp.]